MSRFQKLQQATQFAIAGAILATSLSFPAVASLKGANCASGGEAPLFNGSKQALSMRSEARQIPGWDSSARTDPPTSPDGQPDRSQGGSSR